jgi:hypothetical protein
LVVFSADDELPPSDLGVDLSDVDFWPLDAELESFEELEELDELLSAAADFL